MEAQPIKLSDVNARRQLAHRVIDAIRLDARVVSIGFFGSLGSPEPDGYPSDRFSDVDLLVRVEGCSDREFFFDLPALLADVGPILMRSAWVERDRYTLCVWFEGYPLFWGVDIACIGDRHEPGADVMEEYKGAQAFGLWLGATKRYLRAVEHLRLIAPRLGVDEDVVRSLSPDTLQNILELWAARPGGDARIHGLGRELLKDLVG